MADIDVAGTGKFYPFNRYVQDIALIMDGTHKIVPSRFVLLKGMTSTYSSTWGSTETSGAETRAAAIAGINSIISQFTGDTLETINYNRTRKQVIEYITSKVDSQDTYSGNKQFIGGDITFLSHDVYDGMLYTEIYIHVSPEDGKYRLQFDTNGLITDGQLQGSPIDFEFDGVLITYDIFKLGSSTAFAKDIPLGLFILNEPQGLDIDAGTSWSTRICSRFVSAFTAGIDNNLNTGASDYATMTKILAKFGEVIESIEKANSSRQEDMLTIKQYLDDFKRNQTVNVPYLVGSVWYVNGRPASQLDIYASLAEQVNGLDEIVNGDGTGNGLVNTVGDISTIIESNSELFGDPTSVGSLNTFIAGPGPNSNEPTINPDPDDPEIDVY